MPETSTSTAARIELRRVSKSYGGVHALSDVSLTIVPGEIHALCGENGAGKSTLIKLVAGAVAPDSGEILVDGRALPPLDVRASEAAGVAVIHQEPTVFPHLDAAENVFAGREPTRLGGLLLDRRRMHEETRQLLRRLGEDFDTRRPADELSTARRQMVAMARALAGTSPEARPSVDARPEVRDGGTPCAPPPGAVPCPAPVPAQAMRTPLRFLMLDEPTASLSSRETEVLFGIVRALRAEGVSVLYASHRLEEVFALADRVTVLRDGRLVGTRDASGLTRSELVRMMVGRELREEPRPSAREGSPREGKPLLQVKLLTREGAFRDVTLSVRPGEIVALAGLVGAGRSELARAIFGIDRPDSGEVLVAGRRLPPLDVRASLEAGLAMVPEDRHTQGLVGPMSVGANLTLAVLRWLTRRGLVASDMELKLVLRQMERLSVKAAGPSAGVETLSGGNQQKVLLGKWLATSPRVLILDEPTRGVDVGAKAEIHGLVRELAKSGMATLLISSELPEVLALADRIVVMREGEVSGELDGREATQERVLELALPEGPRAPQCRRGTGAEGRVEERPGIGRLLAEGARRLPGLLRRREYGLAALLALTVVCVTAVNPSFLAPGNLRDMLVACAPAAIAACGLTLVVVAGEIDISIGSLMGLLAAAAGSLSSPLRAGLAVPAAVAIVLILGAGVGLANGLLVVLGRVPSIIVTLGMLAALRGVTEMVMAGEWITDLPQGLRVLGTGTLAGVPSSVWAAAFAVALTWALARRTPLGLRIYAVGSRRSAASVAGIDERRVKLFAFVYLGLLTAVATLVSAPQLSVIEAGVGKGFELLVVTCVVVGGAAVSGGRGTILGTVLGVLLLGTVRTVLLYLKLGERSTYWERAIQGTFILLAVLADHVAHRRRGAGGRS